MCKHILITRFTRDDMPLLADFADRTYDQCGFGAIIRHKNGELSSMKSLSLPALYLELGAAIQKDDIASLVVHHRTSTNKDGLDYAHPFEHKGHLMTHNGVVSVPKRYDTRTENDSEQLLHHFLDTDYETKSIQGYFSCFIKNPASTIVLVDDKAPTYTDGRVYSSHNMGESFRAIKNTMLRLDPLTGHVKSEKPIEVAKSSYGMNLAHKSLGESYTNDSAWAGYDDGAPLPYSRVYSEPDALEYLADSFTYADEEELFNARNWGERLSLIIEKANEIGIKLEKQEAEYLCDLYSN